MGDVKLELPRLLVVREGHEDLELQVINPDMLRWDMTRPKHKWPDGRSAPNLWLTFLSWAAARRTGATEDRWETWQDVVLEVRTLDDDEDGNGVGDPFPEDPEDGSWSSSP